MPPILVVDDEPPGGRGHGPKQFSHYNSVHSGAIRTPMVAGPDTAAFAAAAVSGLAIPRMAEPEEITRLVLFVASDEASFSTGCEFIADGGHLLGPVSQQEPAEATVA